MRVDPKLKMPKPYRVVIVTLDAHSAGPCERVSERLSADFPGLSISVHAAAEWAETPASLQAAQKAVGEANIVITTLLFLEEHIRAISPALQNRRDAADAVVGIVSDAAIVKMTKMGKLDMSAPASGAMALLKRLRGSSKPSTETGAKKMRMLRRLPRILKFIPGTAQDLRAWFVSMQYWLAASDANMEAMIRFLVSRYANRADWKGCDAPAPLEYPDTGLYHPALKKRITTELAELPTPKKRVGTVGVVMLRSYVLAADTAHYDAVISGLEARGLRVIPAFAGGLDSRPAIDTFFRDRHGRPVIDALLSLTGFSLVGGPAYNDSDAAIDILSELDVPYIAAHPLEFQTLDQWAQSKQGLGPVETTMLIALPELDGATQPTVFAGRHGDGGCSGCAHACKAAPQRQMAPCPERVEVLSDRVAARVSQSATRIDERKVAIVIHGFPPNAGAAGTAAYLDVFRSLFNTLTAMKAEGYTLDVPPSVEDLRASVLGGNAETLGQDANVFARVDAETIVAKTPVWLSEIENIWGAAPGRTQSDGRSVFILGQQFGNVFVGLQPAFGYEGDPMRLLFERGFAPTHAFAQFYLWLQREFRADALLHFGMHGALEFMPGKQAGPSGADWPDRLIADLPNVYLYAANNPSEATLAKRRSGAVTVSHLTPPLARAGPIQGAGGTQRQSASVA